jgi:DNA oxidative demethylase
MDRLIPRERSVVVPGAVHLPGWLDRRVRRRLITSCRTWAEAAGGWHVSRMPNGSTMSVGIVCLGWHWYPYRYSRTVDDGDGRAVAPFPSWLGDLARAAVGAAAESDRAVLALPDGASLPPASFEPDIAIVNWYGPGARMGMHQDRDERCLAPVVSFSVGDTATFRFGSAHGRGRPWTDVVLESGDAFVFGGPARLAYHGVPKVEPGTGVADVDEPGGRCNVTVRQSGLTDAA